jgi:hypothetical protein
LCSATLAGWKQLWHTIENSFCGGPEELLHLYFCGERWLSTGKKIQNMLPICVLLLWQGGSIFDIQLKIRSAEVLYVTKLNYYIYCQWR